jgi:hypothetical protein
MELPPQRTRRTSPEVEAEGRKKEEEEEVRQLMPFQVQHQEEIREQVTIVPEGTRADRISQVPSRPVQDLPREDRQVSRMTAVREDAEDAKAEEVTEERTEAEIATAAVLTALFAGMSIM